MFMDHNNEKGMLADAGKKKKEQNQYIAEMSSTRRVLTLPTCCVDLTQTRILSNCSIYRFRNRRDAGKSEIKFRKWLCGDVDVGMYFS